MRTNSVQWIKWVAGVAIAMCVCPAQAQVRTSPNFALTVDEINAGGGQSSSTNFAQRGSLGQPVAAVSMSSSHYTSYSGLQAILPAPYLVLAPAALHFGSQNVGTTSAGQNVTLTNSGNVQLSLTTGFGGTDSSQFGQQSSTCGSTLAVAANCTVGVVFSPTSPGSKIAALAVSSNSPGGPQTVALDGTGNVVVAPAVSLSTNSLSFALQRVGTLSAAQAVTLTNTGAATLNISGINTIGDFTRSTTCGSTLAAGANCTINVTFAPTATGARAGSLTIASNASTSPDTVTLAGTALGRTATDFNADGKSDVLWRNTAGDDAIWFMNGTALASGALTATVADSNWVIGGSGDFNADGYADILWRNTATGDTAIWLMNGATISSGALIANVPTTWSIAGVGDFNGDGYADILWRDNAGNNAIWLMNGTTLASGALIGAAPTAWAIVGIGDFNGDGKSDILWRNATTGDNAIWQMNSFTIAAGGLLTNVADPNWTIAGVGDFNGDGYADILWRNTATGDSAIWQMNGLNLAAGALLTNVPTTWSIVGTGDYDGDGYADILWRDSAGNDAIWLMNGFNLKGGALIPAAPTNWSIVRTR